MYLRYVTMTTILSRELMIWVISSRDSGSAKCRSSKQKQMNLWLVNMRSTSRKVFMSLMDFVDVPARRKSCEPWAGGLDALPDALGESGDDPRRLRPAGLPDAGTWAVDMDLANGFSTGPRRNSGRPRTLCSMGHMGRTYCFSAWWKGVSVFLSPQTCLKSGERSLSKGPNAVLLAVSNLAVARGPRRR